MIQYQFPLIQSFFLYKQCFRKCRSAIFHLSEIPVSILTHYMVNFMFQIPCLHCNVSLPKIHHYQDFYFIILVASNVGNINNKWYIISQWWYRMCFAAVSSLSVITANTTSFMHCPRTYGHLLARSLLFWNCQ